MMDIKIVNMDTAILAIDHREFVELCVQLNKLKKKYDNMTLEKLNKMKDDLARKIKKLEKEINDIQTTRSSLYDHKIIID